MERVYHYLRLYFERQIGSPEVRLEGKNKKTLEK